MKILNLSTAQKDNVTRFNSQGTAVLHLFQHTGSFLAVAMYVEPNGVIGRHQATENQLFIVVQGDGFVCGSENVATPITSGQAALWQAGEFHETRAGAEGLIAIVLEGEGIDPDF